MIGRDWTGRDTTRRDWAGLDMTLQFYSNVELHADPSGPGRLSGVHHATFGEAVIETVTPARVHCPVRSRGNPAGDSF